MGMISRRHWFRTAGAVAAGVATGVGDITLVCPDRASGPIWVRSTFGNITVEIPDAMQAAVQVRRKPLSQVTVGARFEEVEPGLWLTADYEDGEDALSVEVVSVLGNVNIT